MVVVYACVFVFVLAFAFVFVFVFAFVSVFVSVWYRLTNIRSELSCLVQIKLTM